MILHDFMHICCTVQVSLSLLHTHSTTTKTVPGECDLLNESLVQWDTFGSNGLKH